MTFVSEDRYLWKYLIIVNVLIVPSLSKCIGCPTIAIIGGGIGGASSAYSLRKLIGNDVILHLYEPKQIGGRMATMIIADREYEAGASILHPANKYMIEFVNVLGLKRKDASPGVLGIYNGKEYVFKESSWDWITILRLLWRYGTDVLKLQSFVTGMLEKFSRIYGLHANLHAFSTVQKLLSAMDPSFVNMTAERTVFDILKEKHFSDRFINELAEAVMRVNYGQSIDIGGFVGSVSLAGAEPGLWSVHGGNKQVPQKLLEISQVTRIKHEVEQISLIPNQRYSVTTRENSSYTYDAVIVAVPLINGISNISFKNFPDEVDICNGTYHRTVATFVDGELNRTAVGLMSDDVIDQILVNNQMLPFNSIAHQYPVNYSKSENVPQVWKIFSRELLTEKEIKKLFLTTRDVRSVNWLAYPHYVIPRHLCSFVLHPGLYHTSSIEWAASAMEMSAIAGRNVALMAYNHLASNSRVNIDIFDSKTKDVRDDL